VGGGGGELTAATPPKHFWPGSCMGMVVEGKRLMCIDVLVVDVLVVDILVVDVLVVDVLVVDV
jgi:hypothetical protein